MKRKLYRIEIAGRIFGTREQVNNLTKVVNQHLASIDAKGGMTTVGIDVAPEKVATVSKSKAATAQQGEVKPN